MSNTAIILLCTLTFLASGLLMLLLIYRKKTDNPKNASFDQMLADLQTSEFESLYNKDIIIKNPWAKLWYEKHSDAGKRFDEPTQAHRIPSMIVIIGALFGFMVFPGGIIGLITLPIIGIVAYNLWLRNTNIKRMKIIDKQLPSLLASLRANLQASATPQTALTLVADGIPAPLGDEIRIVKNDIQAGIRLDKAMNAFAERIPSREVQFLVAAFNSATNSGGDLEKPLEKIQDTIVARERLAGKFAAAAAAITPQKIVVNLAIPAGFAYSTFQHGLDFWKTPIGIILLVVVGVLWAGGTYVIRKIIDGIEKA